MAVLYDGGLASLHHILLPLDMLQGRHPLALHLTRCWLLTVASWSLLLMACSKGKLLPFLFQHCFPHNLSKQKLPSTPAPSLHRGVFCLTHSFSVIVLSLCFFGCIFIPPWFLTRNPIL